MLRLLEFDLIECSGIESIFTVLGPLSALQKLHLLDSTVGLPGPLRTEKEPSLPGAKARLEQLREAVFGLPNLLQLSGRCSLFSMGLPEGWTLWTEKLSEPDTMLADARVNEQIWRKELAL